MSGSEISPDGITNIQMEGWATETPDGDIIVVSHESPAYTVLIVPLHETMTTEGAQVLSARIHERFPGCFLDDTPPGPPPGRRLRGQKVA